MGTEEEIEESKRYSMNQNNIKNDDTIYQLESQGRKHLPLKRNYYIELYNVIDDVIKSVANIGACRNEVIRSVANIARCRTLEISMKKNVSIVPNCTTTRILPRRKNIVSNLKKIDKLDKSEIITPGWRIIKEYEDF